MAPSAEDSEQTDIKHRRYLATARFAVRLIAIVLPVAGSLTAYWSATSDARARSQATKNKAEAGYQVTRQAMEALEHRVLVLEEAAREREMVAARPPKKGHKHAAPPAPPIPVVVTPHPKALPSDLDKAETQVYRITPPPQTPAPPDAVGGTP